jgi:hypothetical protein
MTRIMISVDDEVARKARIAAAQRRIRISTVAENALRAFITESNVGARRRMWPAPIGRRTGTVEALVDAIDKDQR